MELLSNLAMGFATAGTFEAIALEKAVKGMLPKNKLASQVFSKLKVYAGPEHPHEAQQPEKLELTTGRTK